MLRMFTNIDPSNSQNLQQNNALTQPLNQMTKWCHLQIQYTLQDQGCLTSSTWQIASTGLRWFKATIPNLKAHLPTWSRSASHGRRWLPAQTAFAEHHSPPVSAAHVPVLHLVPRNTNTAHTSQYIPAEGPTNTGAASSWKHQPWWSSGGFSMYLPVPP